MQRLIILSNLKLKLNIISERILRVIKLRIKKKFTQKKS